MPPDAAAGRPLTVTEAVPAPLRAAITQISSLVAPMRQDIDMDDAGNAAVFLLSDMGRHITGEILHVDAGYNILGLWEGVEIKGVE